MVSLLSSILRGAQAAAAKPSQPGVAIEGSIGFGLPQAPAKASLVTGNVLPGNAVAETNCRPGRRLLRRGNCHPEIERGGEIRTSALAATASVTPSANGTAL